MTSEIWQEQNTSFFTQNGVCGCVWGRWSTWGPLRDSLSKDFCKTHQLFSNMVEVKIHSKTLTPFIFYHCTFTFPHARQLSHKLAKRGKTSWFSLKLVSKSLLCHTQPHTARQLYCIHTDALLKMVSNQITSTTSKVVPQRISLSHSMQWFMAY